MLDRAELIADCDWCDIEGLAEYFQPYRVEDGCELFREGDAGNFLCVLVEGSVRAFKERDASEHVLVSTENAGRSIGEMALIDGEPRSATCISVGESTVLLLTRDAYQLLCRERPALALKLVHRIARLVSRRLRVTSGRLSAHLG